MAWENLGMLLCKDARDEKGEKDNRSNMKYEFSCSISFANNAKICPHLGQAGCSMKDYLFA